MRIEPEEVEVEVEVAPPERPEFPKNTKKAEASGGGCGAGGSCGCIIVLACVIAMWCGFVALIALTAKIMGL